MEALNEKIIERNREFSIATLPGRVAVWLSQEAESRHATEHQQRHQGQWQRQVFQRDNLDGAIQHAPEKGSF